jgi:hypothetical protein
MVFISQWAMGMCKQALLSLEFCSQAKMQTLKSMHSQCIILLSEVGESTQFGEKELKKS